MTVLSHLGPPTFLPPYRVCLVVTGICPIKGGYLKLSFAIQE